MKLTRREFLSWAGKALGAMVLPKETEWAGPGTLPARPLGRTGCAVTLFGLGGGGILRTAGRTAEAVSVIRRALEQGVNFFDAAPDCGQNEEYLGEALQGDRKKIFLASKTRDRSRDGSLELLESSLRRLKTGHLDLWQLDGLREMSDLEQLFSKEGAIRAVEQAKAEKRIRFVGITGEWAPDVLAEAVRRYPFDAAAVPINPADRARLSFIEEFLPLAAEKGMGVIARKVTAGGALLEDPARLTPAEAIRYALGQPGVSTALVGCSTPEEVDQNAAAARLRPLPPEERVQLEERVRLLAPQYAYFKRG